MRRRGAFAHPSVAFAALSLASGCGGGAALMHPAHTLPARRVSFGAGVSHRVVLGEAARTIDAGADADATPASADDHAHAAITAAALGPGSSPWLGARVGLSHRFEAGVTYTGRTARLDARRAFERESVALSIGAGGSTKLARPLGGGDTSDVPGLDDAGTGGFGFDLPVLVGWRSSNDFLQAWLGARAGYERIRGDILLRGSRGELDAERWFVGGLVGLMVGVRPVWLVLELDGAYERGRGRLEGMTSPASPPPAINEFDGSFRGFGLAPTGALLTRF